MFLNRPANHWKPQINTRLLLLPQQQLVYQTVSVIFFCLQIKPTRTLPFTTINMHRSRMSIFSAVAVISLVLPIAAAVTLDDFTPRATNLTSACETVYTSDIDGCESSDFASGECSSTCVTALNALTTSVQQDCTGATSGDNIITAMLDGEGVLRICPNAASGGVVTSASSSSSSISSSTTTQSMETTSIGSGVLVLSSAAATTNGILVDTSQPSATSAAGTAKTDAPVASSTSSGDESDGILYAATTGTSMVTATSSTTTSKSSSASSDTTSGTLFDETGDSHRLDTSLLYSMLAATLGALLVWQ